MKVRIAIIILFIPFILSGQEGIPYISHFDESSDFRVLDWSICQDTQNLMLFANRLGITTYDGNRWNKSRLQHIPLILKKDPVSGIIYAGAANNYGILEADRKGAYNYNSISGDTASLGFISGVHFTESSVIFSGEQSISIHDRKKPGQYTRWYAMKDAPFTGFISKGDNYFINVSGKGLHRIDADTLFPIVTGYLTKNTDILFALEHNANRILVGTSDNMLYLFDGIKFYPYSLSEKEYLAENILSDGVIIADSLYAFSTLYGGVLLVRKSDRKVLHQLNYQNGLPDDEIYAIGSDNNEGLWISHGMGICRADLSLPLRDFSNYPGLQGVVTTSLWYNGELYIGTNEGLWYLDEVRNNPGEEIPRTRVLPKEPARLTPELQTRNIISPVSPDQEKIVSKQEEEPQTTKKGFFNKLFGRTAENESMNEATIQDENKTVIGIPNKEEAEAEASPENAFEDELSEQVKRDLSRKVNLLKPVDYIYRKVDGLYSRCTSIEATDHGLLVATTAGLYSVIDHRAISVTENSMVHDIAASTDPGTYYIATEEGISEIIFNGKNWYANQDTNGINEPVYSLVTTGENNLWASATNILFCFLNDPDDKSLSVRTYTFDSDFPDRCRMVVHNDTLLLLTETGILFFSQDDGLLRPYATMTTTNKASSNMRFIVSAEGIPWISPGDGWKCLSHDIGGVERLETLLRLFDEVVSIHSDNNGSYWITDRESGIYRIRDFALSLADPVFNIFINNLETTDGRLFFDLENLVFEPYINSVSVNISAPHYIKEATTRYQYFIEGHIKDWSPWSYNPEIDLSLIQVSGSYTVHLRAINILGKLSEEKIISFTIKPPFIKTIWFYILISIGGIGLFAGFLYIREGKLRHDKEVLEDKVRERTNELETKKEQIEAQRDEILKQKEEITSSITYASRIQDAILPGHKIFRKVFREHLIFFRPRDIVSGDFYWISETDDRICFAVADCTGHGVPGAIMSMLGISLLNEIIANNIKSIKPGAVLGLLREKVIFSLKQSGRQDEANDGMDVAFCILNRKLNILEFAGAFNPLYLVRDGVLTEYKADRMPIGYHVKQSEFTDHKIKIKPGDSVYIFSDGFYDQFGGPHDKRFSSGMMKRMLRDISDLPMEEQKIVLENRLRKWKGSHEQVDDILILGVKI